MDKALVLGSINVDWIVEVEGFPRPGETIMAERMTESFGGKGANQAVALTQLEMATQFLGHVGGDDSGRRVLAFLREKGIETQTVVSVKTHPTGKAIIYVDPLGENEIVVIPGANHEATIQWLEAQKQWFRENNVLVLQFELPIEVVERAIQLGKEHDMFVVVNPAPFAKLDPLLYSKIDLLIPNEQEALDLSGMTTLQDAVCFFLGHGVGHLAITRGEKGVLGASKDTKTSITKPAITVPVKDTTGAGDCFVAGLTWAMTQGKQSFEEALDFANRMASLSVMRQGTMASYPTLKELRELGTL